MSLVLSALVAKPLRASHSRTVLSPCWVEAAVAEVVAEMARIVPSSIYKFRSLWTHVSVRSSSGEVYRAERIGEREDP